MFFSMPQRLVAAERILELRKYKRNEIIRRIFDWVVLLASSIVFIGLMLVSSKGAPPP